MNIELEMCLLDTVQVLKQRSDLIYSSAKQDHSTGLSYTYVKLVRGRTKSTPEYLGTKTGPYGRFT